MTTKILFIIESLVVGGGAERVISLLTKKISSQFDIHILTLKNAKNLYSYGGKYYSISEDLSSYSKISRFFRLYNILFIIKIYKLIISISPDIIVSVMVYPNLLTILTKMLFRINIPLLVPIHFNPNLAYKVKSRLFNFIFKKSYRLNTVDKIITVSKEVQKIFEKEYKINSNKLKTIYNGIEIEKIKEMKEADITEYKELFFNKELTKFITVGRLSQVKGHIYLIEAFSKVKLKIPNSKLFIIGEGPLKDNLEKLIREKNLQKDIILLGYQENPFKYISKSDIFTLSSKNEALPMVLLEALACGIPIISTNCKTGPKEILDNGRYGFLVNVMDPDDLAEKMIFLAKNKDILKEFSQKSLNRAEFFGIDKFLTEWISLLNKFT